MTREIFIDTGAWVSLLDRRDPKHLVGSGFFAHSLAAWPVWVTTNLVVAEAYTLIQRRGGHTVAVQFLTILQEPSPLIKVYADHTSELQAEAILRQYADQDFSYVDAVSFAVMRQRRISEAFAFDHHFTTAGFTRVV